MDDERTLFEPIGWTKTAFAGWTDQALEGYIIMVKDQVSASMFDRGRARFQEKLAEAQAERGIRHRRKQEQRVQVIELHSEMVMKEEISRIYQHEMSGSSDP